MIVMMTGSRHDVDMMMMSGSVMVSGFRYNVDDDREHDMMMMMTGSRHDVDDGWITISRYDDDDVRITI